MYLVQIDVAHHMVFLRDHEDLFRTLDNVDRLHRIEQEGGYPDRPTAHLARVTGLSGKYLLVAFSHFVSRPRLKDRAVEIANVKCRLHASGGGDRIADARMRRIAHDGTGTRRGRQEFRALGDP